MARRCLWAMARGARVPLSHALLSDGFEPAAAGDEVGLSAAKSGGAWAEVTGTPGAIALEQDSRAPRWRGLAVEQLRHSPPTDVERAHCFRVRAVPGACSGS
jgi:hypothetical protein